MTGKYTPLEQYLSNLAENQKEVTHRFEQIEKILSSKLPSSANEDRRWWDHETEGNHINKRAWSNAGWKVDEVNFLSKLTRFVRVI